MATAKQAHALVTYFVEQYTETYGFKPVLNRYAARWGFDSILHDLSVAQTKELVDFYFSTASANKHSLDWFLYNYDKLLVSMAAAAKDRETLARLREETKQRTEEWRKRKVDD